MSDDRSTFEVTRARLEDIVVQVRRKDVSLEQSLDLLEEAVRLVNQCNDLIDQTSFRAVAAEGTPAVAADPGSGLEDPVDSEIVGEGETAGDDEIDGEDETADDEIDGEDETADDEIDGEDEAVMIVVEIEDDERS